MALVTPSFNLDKLANFHIQIQDLAKQHQVKLMTYAAHFSKPFLSLLRGVWEYDYPESHIHHITWSARVHHDYQGNQPVNAMYVTDAHEGIKSDIQLNDGDKYFLSVHACNGAHICLLQDEVIT